MPFDKWGIPFFYPTAKTAGVTGTGTGFFWEQSDDVTKDSFFSDEGHVTNSSGGTWTMKTSGPDAVQIAKNNCCSQTVTGGCSMNFDTAVTRGYGFKADDPRDIELKFLVKFVDSGSDNGFAVEGPTGAHSSSGCCSGNCYKVDIQYRANPTVFRFRKEMWHVSNSTDPKTGEFTHPLANFQLLGAGFVGIGYCRYNLKDAVTGHNTKDAVGLELWFNPHPDTNIADWTMLKRTIDTGGWGNDGDKCNGDKDQIGSFSMPKFRLKSNDASGEFQFKHLSLREIDPTLSFDDTPTTPPEPPSSGGGSGGTSGGTVQGSFKFQWNINTVGSSACAGAGTGGGAPGGTGNTIFYSVAADSDRELSDSSTFQNRTRIVMTVDNSSSIFSGKLVKQIDIPLKKVGSPSSSGDNVHMKIYNASDSVVYESPTLLDPSTLTTSYVKKTFDFSTNTHALVTGDRIGVKYTTTSSSNYVVASYQGTATANTTYAQFENGSYDTKSRSLAMDVWQ